MLTLAVFLAPAVLAPGPVEIANIAGVALAIWLAADAWRIYGRTDLRATLPYRISPVAPGILGAAAVLFTLSILHGWTVWSGETAADLMRIETRLLELWSFPFSPVAMFARPSAYLPSMSDDAVRGVTLCLSAAVALGGVFGLLALVGGIWDRGDLRRHALIWRGVRIASADEALAARGARGLAPVRDPVAAAAHSPVSGRLMVRAVSMLIAIVILPYAPFFLRFFAGSGIKEVDAFFASPFMSNFFFSAWFTGLWSMLVAGAIIFFFAYLRLAFALRLR